MVIRFHPGPRAPQIARALNFTLTLLATLPLAALPASAAAKLDPARVKEIAGWLPPQPASTAPALTNRAAWEKLSLQKGFADVVTVAERLAKTETPALPDDLFLDYSRTGNRDRGQKVMFARGDRLENFVLAECLENRSRFIGPLTNVIAALCAERTWVYPAHDGNLGSFYGRTTNVDLRATAVAWELATAAQLLGDKLSPATRTLIRANVQRRVLQPIRDMVEGRRAELGWLRATHNWNAVCLAGVTGAALALEESPEQRALFIAAAEHYIRNFWSGFTPDGYCSEGMGYWNYGYGRFLMLAETVRQATGGKLDLLADPAALPGALFATRAEILNDIYPTIADCSPGARPDPKMVRYLDERLGLQPTGNRAEIFGRPGGLAATALFAFLPERLPLAQRADKTGDSPLRTWFKDGGVLICRTARAAKTVFAAALKGGHNAEHHNHNDVGSFSVVLGNSMVLCDPGAEVYTARTFSPKRYDSKVLNSYGHAVPVIAGQLQRTGAAARGVVLRTDFTDRADMLSLDIRSAYAVPELQKLERTFVFQRDDASLSVRDEVAFTTPQAFETALLTWGEWKQLSPQEILVQDGESAVRVKIDTGGLPFVIRGETLNEDVRSPRKPVRIGIALKAPVEKATVLMTITPAPPDGKSPR